MIAITFTSSFFMINHSARSKFAVPGVKALKSYLLKKAEKTRNFGENVHLFQK